MICPQCKREVSQITITYNSGTQIGDGVCFDWVMTRAPVNSHVCIRSDDALSEVTLALVGMNNKEWTAAVAKGKRRMKAARKALFDK